MDSLIYQSPLLKIGLFRVQPWEPKFENSGPIKAYLLVFPRTSVTITHVGKDPVITSPNLVMFYNLGQEYRRGKVSERGDVCEWFAFDPQVIVDALKCYDVTVLDRADQPFRFTHGPSDTDGFLLQRLVVEHLLQEDIPNSLFIEETMLNVLDRCLAIRHRVKHKKKGQINPEHKELTWAIQRLLSTHFHEPFTLETLANTLHYSQYQLARIFRQQTGQTIHQYLDQLRVRTALEELSNRDKDLSALAYELGYSSHSHFTAAFKRSFGYPPSCIRDTSQWINSVLPASQTPFTKRANF